MRKFTKADAENLENMLKTVKWANDALRKGFGPAAFNSNNIYVAIPGTIEYEPIPGLINNKAYYALVIEKDENGARPVDWYSWGPDPNFLSGFGGWHNYDYDEFVKENPWVKEAWDSLDKDIKAVFEKKL